MHKALVWIADSGCGGFGDRMVGLVSAYLLARRCDRQFYIWWKSPDISDTLRIRATYDYTKINKTNTKHGPIVNWIDRRPPITPKMFAEHDDSVLFMCNQYLDTGASVVEVRKTYQELCSTFFEPTEAFARELVAFKTACRWHTYKNKVAFQVRLGDHQLGQPNTAALGRLLQSRITKELAKLADPKLKTTVYFSSDCEPATCLPLLRSALPPGVDLVSCCKPVEHLDRARALTRDGRFKLMIDFYLMAECTRFVIPWHSNLSRVAMLTSPGALQGVVYRESPPATAIDCVTVTDANMALLFTKHDGTQVRVN